MAVSAVASPTSIVVKIGGELVQGDTLRPVASDIATLCHPLQSLEEWLDPNVVKVTMDARGHALYFSRAPIPWQRDGATREAPRLPQGLACRHIGLYAYRVAALNGINRLV